MARTRKKIEKTFEGKNFVCRFFHPILRQTVRLVLGPDQDQAEGKLRKLNEIFLNEVHWLNPPNDSPEIRDAWLGSNRGVQLTPDNTVKLDGRQVVPAPVLNCSL